MYPSRIAGNEWLLSRSGRAPGARRRKQEKQMKHEA